MAETTAPKETTDEHLAAKETGDPPKKRNRGNAAKRLRKATMRVVRDNSTQIAQALLDRALKGDVSSAKLLVSLIQTEEANREASKAAKRTAESQKKSLEFFKKLAAEPQWEGPDLMEDLRDEYPPSCFTNTLV